LEKINGAPLLRRFQLQAPRGSPYAAFVEKVPEDDKIRPSLSRQDSYNLVNILLCQFREVAKILNKVRKREILKKKRCKLMLKIFDAVVVSIENLFLTIQIFTYMFSFSRVSTKILILITFLHWNHRFLLLHFPLFRLHRKDGAQRRKERMRKKQIPQKYLYSQIMKVCLTIRTWHIKLWTI